MLAITSVLEERHHVGTGKPDDFEVQSFQRVADRTRQTLAATSTGIAAGAVLALAIAGFGIMNIMLLSVSERTPEIGIRLAVGARGTDLRVQFLAEALTLCLGGVLLGSVVSLAVARIVSQQAGVPVVPPAGALLVAAGISCGVGLVFAIYPAERAARLDPVVALRME
jgi:ABC-type antimicrobial peptide transport system permease subunit